MTGKIQQVAYSCQQVLLDFRRPVAYRSRMALGKRLKQARDKRELTQEQLVAKVPGATQASLSALESRDSDKSELIFGYADALRVEARWLQTGEEPSGLEAPLAERDHLYYQLTTLYHGLTDASRHRLAAFANGLHAAEHPEPSPSNPFGKSKSEAAPGKASR